MKKGFALMMIRRYLMQTWMFIMGIQMIVFIICAVWVIVWMRKDNDEYDEALERIEENNLKKKMNS